MVFWNPFCYWSAMFLVQACSAFFPYFDGCPTLVTQMKKWSPGGE